MEEKKITITKEDFMGAMSKTFGSARVKGLLSTEPMLTLLLTTVCIEVMNKLFNEGTEEEE